MKTRLLIIFVFFVVFAAYTEFEVYGHDVGARFDTGFYRIENETYPKTTVNVGEPFFIHGTVVSLVERDIQGKMNVRFNYA